MEIIAVPEWEMQIQDLRPNATAFIFYSAVICLKFFKMGEHDTFCVFLFCFLDISMCAPIISVQILFLTHSCIRFMNASCQMHKMLLSQQKLSIGET